MPTLLIRSPLAGKRNENFLNAELFSKAFLAPCESVRSYVGLLMFEFSRFYVTDYRRGRDFVADLDKFLRATAKRVAPTSGAKLAKLVVKPNFDSQRLGAARLAPICISNDAYSLFPASAPFLPRSFEND